ncbi:hypothetical protein GCK32_016604 [Trichostrongylus colubriformis]|uniref:Uncharacterized protein n=1 Tax=Trichostrongylus colubriformis TaxID=6319 RepID=A0AAN8J296_TRICO
MVQECQRRFSCATLRVILQDFTLQENKNTTITGKHDDNTTSIPRGEKRPITILLSVPHMESTFLSINRKWIKKPIWDYGIARDAIIEAVIRNRTQADFKIYRRKKFLKGEINKSTIAGKVEELLSPVCPSYLRRNSSILGFIYGTSKNPCSIIPKSSSYGCNGFFDTTGKDDVLTVACLYKKKRDKSRRVTYKNIEI